MSEKKKGWPKIGTLRKNDKGFHYIKLEDDVKLIVNGETVDLNDYRTLRLQDPRETAKFMHERGIITEKQLDERLETLAENSWLRYEIVAPPNQTSK